MTKPIYKSEDYPKKHSSFTAGFLIIIGLVFLYLAYEIYKPLAIDISRWLGR